MKRPTSTIWVTAIAIAASLGTFYFVIRPMNQKRVALGQDMVLKEATLVKLNRSTASMAHSTAKADALRDAVAGFESKLPADGQMDKVLEDVWRMAQANSLQTRTIKTPAVQKSAGFSEQTMDLSLAGDFAGFYQFLLQLEDAKHVMRIKKMHLIKINDRDGEMEADVTLGVLFRPTGG